MKIKIYQVDAFTDKVFSGNPAAICPLYSWPSDDLLQKIAMENNLPETGFYLKKGKEYQIRWFTPTVEVDLCGHATLAAAHVIFNHQDHPTDEIQFISPRSGKLSISRQSDFITMNFPSDTFKKVELSSELIACFDIKPKEALKGKTDFMLVFDNESQIANIQAHLHLISKIDARGIIVTAPGDKVDFVSRFFGPQSGIDEDPVTGSAHTTLTPYWAKKLGRIELTAIQLSKRKGYLKCVFLNERVEISGHARTYMTGEIEI